MFNRGVQGGTNLLEERTNKGYIKGVQQRGSWGFNLLKKRTNKGYIKVVKQRGSRGFNLLE